MRITASFRATLRLPLSCCDTSTLYCVLSYYTGRYFFGVGADVEIITEDIDYFAFQGDLADVSAKLSAVGADTSPFIQVRACLLAFVCMYVCASTVCFNPLAGFRSALRPCATEQRSHVAGETCS